MVLFWMRNCYQLGDFLLPLNILEWCTTRHEPPTFRSFTTRSPHIYLGDNFLAISWENRTGASKNPILYLHPCFTLSPLPSYCHDHQHHLYYLVKSILTANPVWESTGPQPPYLVLGEILPQDEPEEHLGKREARKEDHGGLSVLTVVVKFMSLHEIPLGDSHSEVRDFEGVRTIV